MKILIGGDFAPTFEIFKMIEKNDYSFFSELKSISNEFDTTIINLESPFVEDCDSPIVKHGPNLKCSKKTVEALVYAGIDMVTLANNHILDYGCNALLRTQAECERNGIKTIGVGNTLLEAAKPRILEFNHCRLGIINCCEHEFSIATNDTAGANPLDPIGQFNTINEIRSKVDFLIVIVHGGHENYNLPSTRMQKTYRFFIDSGADVVVNHHQHCFSGYEYYRNGVIFYGLGNLCFQSGSNVQDSWYKGYMVGLDFSFDDKMKVRIYPYEQCYKNNRSVHFLSEDTYSQEINELNNIIKSPELLQIHEKEYYDSVTNSTYNVLDILTNKYLIALRNRGLFPNLLSQKYKLRLKNHILCESHLDKIQHFLKNI